MKHMKKLGALFLALTMIFLGGCGEKEGGELQSALEQAAISYGTAIAKQNWDEVLKGSTGDQLSTYLLLVPTFELVEQESELKKIEVMDSVLLENGTGFVTIRLVRSMTLPDYGSVTDDRQILLSMKRIDHSWKVFRMDVVSEQ